MSCITSRSSPTASRGIPLEVRTPGYQWQIRCDRQPLDPYLTFDHIINPWGLAAFPVDVRLGEGCTMEFIIRNVGPAPATSSSRSGDGLSAATGTTRGSAGLHGGCEGHDGSTLWLPVQRTHWLGHSTGHPDTDARPHPDQPTRGRTEARSSHDVSRLRPIRGGMSYQVVTPASRAVVTPELADAIETVLERFAHQAGFTRAQPLQVAFVRGYQADSPGHREGRAVDIAAVAGQSFSAWKRQWDEALSAARRLSSVEERTAAVTSERIRNLGYRLYKALQDHGGWRVDEHGWRPYRGVVQLFGPWTAVEGPWTAMHNGNPDDSQRQRLADQAWVFAAHQDHIHVAR